MCVKDASQAMLRSSTCYASNVWPLSGLRPKNPSEPEFERLRDLYRVEAL